MSRKPWRKATNEELALNLEVWMEMDGRLTTDWQAEFFEEVVFRLLASNPVYKEENEKS